nr:helix-turn-helix domain-containing protein [Salinisphaera sp. G21_0]
MTTETWVDRANLKAREHGLNNAQIAERIGVSRTTVSFWMNNQREPKLEQKMRLADVLQVSLNWLETGRDTLPGHHLPEIRMDQVADLLNKYATKQDELSDIASSAIRIVESTGEKSFVVLLDNDTLLDPSRGDILAIPEGARVQIDTEQQPVQGSIILVEHNGNMVLRLWRQIEPGLHHLRVINPMYQNLNFNHEGDIMAIYRGSVIGYSVTMKR